MIADNEYGNAMIDMIENQPKIGGWIACSERLPEEHDSMFAKFKGTEKWDSAMFEKISDDVNVTVEFEDGKRKTKTLHTVDGKWNGGQRGVKFKVVAWQPLPEEYHGQVIEKFILYWYNMGKYIPEDWRMENKGRNAFIFLQIVIDLYV